MTLKKQATGYAYLEMAPALVPKIILVVSPCRSGSTILLRVFGASGVESYFQPMKNALRWSLMGNNRPWSIPSNSSSRIMVKETLGPYVDAECLFNPLQVLLDAGFPPEKLHVVILGREPLKTWASWNRYWSDRVPVANMIMAFRTANKILEQAKTLGITSTCLVYDLFKDYSPEIVFKNVFKRLGLEYSPLAIQGWEALPNFGQPGSHIVLADEPERFVTPGIHDKVNSAKQFTYADSDPVLASLKPSDLEAIAQSDLAVIYKSWLEESIADLQLN